MQTKLFQPGSELRDVVRYFWHLEIKRTPKDQMELRTFVDDSTGIIFHDGGGESALLKDGGYLPVGLIYGQARFPSSTSVARPFSAVGVLFHPQAIRTLFGVDAHYLTDRTYAISEFVKSADLTRRMIDTESPEQKIRILADFIIRKKESCLGASDKIVEGAIDMIKTHKATSVSNLLKHYRISERQLERRFLASVGVSPRHYLQTQKFELLIQTIRTNEPSKFGTLARELGYADQAHLTRFVRKYAGLTPRELRSKVNHDIINLLF